MTDQIRTLVDHRADTAAGCGGATSRSLSLKAALGRLCGWPETVRCPQLADSISNNRPGQRQAVAAEGLVDLGAQTAAAAAPP